MIRLLRAALVIAVVAVLVGISLVAARAAYQVALAELPGVVWPLVIAIVIVGGAGAALLGHERGVARMTMLTVAAVVGTTSLLADALPALLAVLWLAWLATAIGETITSRLLPRDVLSPSARPVVSMLIGLGPIAIIWWLIGLAGWYSLGPIFTTLVVLSVLVARTMVTVAHNAVAPVRRFWHAPSRMSAASMVIIAFMLVVAWLRALPPDTTFDPIMYQLAVPAGWIRDGAIHDFPFHYRASWSALVGSLYGGLLLVAGQPAPAFLTILGVIALLILAWGIGTSLGGDRVGWLAAVVLVTIPDNFHYAWNAYIDFLSTAFIVAAITLALWWIDHRQRGWLVLLGLAAGFAFSAKMVAILFLVPIAALLLWEALRTRSGRLRTLRDLVVFAALPAIVVSLPWLITRWQWTGNPIHPFFGSMPDATFSLDARPMDWDRFGTDHGILGFLRLPWDMTFIASEFTHSPTRGVFGILPWLALPLFLVIPARYRRVEATRIVFLLLSGGVIWFVVTPYGRYGMTLMVLAAIFVAANLDAAFSVLAAVRKPLTAPLLAATSILLLLCFSSLTYLAVAATTTTPRGIPVAFALGQQSPDAYLRAELRPYPALQEIARLDPDRPAVLSSAGPNVLYGDVRFPRMDFPSAPGGIVTYDEAQLTNYLANAPWDFLVIDFNGTVATRLDPTLPYLNGNDFLDRTYARVYDTDNVVAWDLRAGRSTTPSPEAATLGPTPAPVTGACAITATAPCLEASAIVASPGGKNATTLLTWSTGSASAGNLRVSRDGNPPKNVAGGASGTVEIPWIQPGSTYEFTLVDAKTEALLATIEVRWEGE